MNNYSWAIVGLGEIASQFATTFDHNLGTLVGAASRNLEKAKAFTNEFNIPKAYGSYADLFADPEIDIVYIATPHNHHLSAILPALKSGKHVLCEKAITMTGEELAEAKQVARDNQCVLTEAMTIFNMPLFTELKRRIDNQEFGKLKMIQASFGSYKDANPSNRFFNPELAGGALLDIGTYAFSFVRFFLSEQATVLASSMAPYTTGVDEQSVTILQNTQNEMATVALTFQAKMPKQGIVAFEKAFITINDYPRADLATITYLDGEIETFRVGESAKALNYEVETMTKIINGELDNESLKLTTDVMTIMDTVRQKWAEKD